MNSDQSILFRQEMNQGPGVTPVSEDAAPLNLFGRLAIFCGFATIFILYSRFFDLALNGLYIPRVVISLLILFFLVSGRLFTFAQSSVGKLMVVWLCWVAFTVLFSVWKGGSLPLVILLLQSVLIFVVLAGLPADFSDVRNTTGVLAFAGFVAALMSIPWGDSSTGRLQLAQGSYFDPNYYAMALIVVLPFFGNFVVSSKSYVVKFFCVLAMLPILFTFFKAGSRGALLGFGLMLVLLFFMSSAKIKAFLALSVVLGVSIALVATPAYIRARYLTLFDSSSESDTTQQEAGSSTTDERLGGDTSSAVERKRLLMTSIALTFEHPFVGVGPGNFPTAVFDEGKARGMARNEWLVTHNSYTEISSETGIPGFIIFVTLLILTFKNVLSVLKQSRPNGVSPDSDLYLTAKSLLLSLSATCVCIFFLAIGFDFIVYALMGVAVSLKRTAAARLAAASVDVAEPVVSAAPTPERKRPERVRQPETVRAERTAARSVRFNRFR